jgi:2-alkenal reductase
VITAVEGEPVRQMTDLTDRLERVGVGGEIRVTVAGGGGMRDVTVAVVDIGDL